jgi:hypothetical protein
VNVAAGQHTIELRNIGQDWVNVGSYGFSGVAASALYGCGLKDRRKVYGYCFDTRNGEWIDPAQAQNVTGASVVADSMDAGTYTVAFVNPRTGAATAGADVIAQNGAVTVAFPDFSKDGAFKIVNKAGAGVADSRTTARERRNVSVSASGAFIRVALRTGSDRIRSIAVFDGLGRRIARYQPGHCSTAAIPRPQIAGMVILHIKISAGAAVVPIALY